MGWDTRKLGMWINEQSTDQVVGKATHLPRSFTSNHKNRASDNEAMASIVHITKNDSRPAILWLHLPWNKYHITHPSRHPVTSAASSQPVTQPVTQVPRLRVTAKRKESLCDKDDVLKETGPRGMSQKTHSPHFTTIYLSDWFNAVNICMYICKRQSEQNRKITRKLERKKEEIRNPLHP